MGSRAEIPEQRRGLIEFSLAALFHNIVCDLNKNERVPNGERHPMVIGERLLVGQRVAGSVHHKLKR